MFALGAKGTRAYSAGKALTVRTYMSHHAASEENVARVISVISHKGGTGKTTSAIHFADILSSKGFSVLLLDLDASCNLSNFYQVSGKKTIIDFLEGNKKSIIPVRSGLSAVPGSKKISDFDSISYSATDVYSIIKNATDGLPFDYIIIDTPHAIGRIIKNTIIASDVVVIPVMPAGWSADGSVDVLDEFAEIRASSKKKLIENCAPALLPTAISKWSRHDRGLIPALEMAHPGVTILPRIPFNRDIMKDQSERIVRKTNIYKAYEEVTEWLSK